jgi:hypothetical protein
MLGRAREVLEKSGGKGLEILAAREGEEFALGAKP